MGAKAGVERKEAEIAQEQALVALAAARLAREEAELEAESAAKELAEVEAVREKIEREGGNDVLLRSLLREQQEAMVAQEKAATKKEHAEKLQSEAQETLEAAKKEEREAIRAERKATKYEQKAEREEEEAKEAREKTQTAMKEAMRDKLEREKSRVEKLESVEKGLVVEKQKREQKKKEEKEEIARRKQVIQKLGDDAKMRSEETRDAIAKEHGSASSASSELQSGRKQRSNSKDKVFASMLPPGPPPTSSLMDKSSSNGGVGGGGGGGGGNSSSSSHQTRKSKLEERRRRSRALSAISGNKEKEEKGRSLLSFDQQVASVDGTLRALFDLLDANHDSQLSKVEVMKGLMLQSSEVANILQETKALAPLRHPKAWSGAFKVMDTNCDGHVTLEELRSFVVGIISISTTNDAASKAQLAEEGLSSTSIGGAFHRIIPRGGGGGNDDVGDSGNTGRNHTPGESDAEIQRDALLLKAAVHSIFSLMCGLEEKEGGKEKNNTEEASELVVAKEMLLSRLDEKDATGVRMIVVATTQLHVLLHKSTYSSALQLLKTAQDGRVSERELSQFCFGLIAGRKDLMLQVINNELYQQTMQQQMEVLYALVGMPDGMSMMGKRFSRVRSVSFLDSLREVFSSSSVEEDATKRKRNMKKTKTTTTIGELQTKCPIIFDFLQDVTVVEGLIEMLGGQFWLSKRALELACIGYYASSQKTNKINETVASLSSSPLSLIEAVNILFSLSPDEHRLGGVGLSTMRMVDIITTIQKEET